jgi:hypothetical protein
LCIFFNETDEIFFSFLFFVELCSEAAPDAEMRMRAFLTCMRSEALHRVVPGHGGAVVSLTNRAFVFVCILRLVP